MRRQTWAAVVMVAVVVLATACGDDGEEAEETARDTATTLAEELDEATRLSGDFSGAAEVPGPGDPDGAGTATVNLDVSEGELCYDVTVQNIDPPTAMHIHEGEAGDSGDVVVTLTTPTATDTPTTGCTDVDVPLIARMAAQPDNFYVNVHTNTYRQGAVRAQLAQ